MLDAPPTDDAFSIVALLRRLEALPMATLRVGLAGTRRLLRPRVLLPLTLALGVTVAAAGFKVATQWPLLAPVARAVLSPGTTTAKLSALDPSFRERVENVLDELREQGFKPHVRTTWRSPHRQELIYAGGRLSERVRGTGPATRARGGMSCHNLTEDDGAASLAVDIVAGRRRSGRGHARFYRALGAAARAEGLAWGGDWKRSNRAWARYDLGWDPGHVQSRRCTGARLRSARVRFLRKLESS